MSGRTAVPGLLALAMFAVGCGTGETGAGKAESRLIASGPKGVHLISLDGAGSRLIPGTDGVAEPTWSYEGDRVAFSLGVDVYTARADWSDRQVVFENASAPSWSPDGKRLAAMRDTCEVAPDYDECYIGLDLDNPFDLYAVGSDGADVRRLTSTPGYDGDPAWSPDGERIAFIGDNGLSLISPGGGDRRRLLEGHFLSNPAWSPDGKRIALDNFSEISMVDVESGKRTTLPGGGEGPDFAPAWSPDGKQIAFLANSECHRTRECTAHEPWEVWVMGADGTGARRLTKGGFGPPAWG